MVFKQAVVWVAVGLVVGSAGAWIFSNVLRRVLQDASPFDIPGVTVGAALIFGAALLAAWLPAKRAMNVNPVDALRAE